METQRIFDVLGISETKDENEIKAAYRARLASVNPEDNPEGFKRLRDAYESALALARRQEEEEQQKEEIPADRYMKDVEQVYRSLSKRLDVKEWERLTKNEMLDDLVLEEEIKWKLFRYLADHFRMPAAIWQVLDQAFGIRENAEEFKEHLPEEFVDFMVWKSSEEGGGTDFPFEKLKGKDTADYDEFIRNFNELSQMAGEEPEDKESWQRELGQKIAFMDTLGISHPWYEMEKAKYQMLNGQKEDAEHTVRKLWELGEKDTRMLYSGAGILNQCGLSEEAAEIYRELLKAEGTTNDDIYNVSIALAEICAGRQEWTEAREHALSARRLYNTRKSVDLLSKCNMKIIELYAGERAIEMTAEDGIMVAWCYIQEGKAAEGLDFFREHPVLEEDMADCHRVKSILSASVELDEAAETEAKLWRKCLLEQEKEEPYWLAQSYELEGKALQIRFGKLEEKNGEEAEKLKAAALAAFDEALAVQPEEIDFLMAKLHFLRELKDYGKIVEICDKIKEIDKGYYWAYFYAQEAYEGLGKAQEVVDNFYEAKRIYAGMPEIYERAAGAFWAYGQYGETKNIIRQAEEAGINSFSLRVKKLEIMQREAENEENLKEADEYAKQLIEELEKAEEVKNKDILLSNAYLQRAFIHDSRYASGFRQVDQMESWAKRSVELADSNRNRYFLGRFYAEYKEESKNAYEHLKICEERGLDFEWMYYYLARCHEDFEEWDKAIAYYKKAMEKAPDERDFPWRIAWLYRMKFNRVGQKEYYEEAIRYLNLYVEKYGENTRELWQLSNLHANNREYELALAEIERAMERDGQSRNWGHKGMILGTLGKKDEAVEYYEKGIAVGLEKGTDYGYAYSQMHDYFCELKEYEKGLAWFKEKIELVKTEEQRRKILDYIKYYYIMLKDFPKALDTLKQVYGGISLTDYVCDGWEQEGERISDLLDLYQFYLSPEELRKKTEEAVALADGEGADKLKQSHEGKKSAYIQIAFCFAHYLMDEEKGILYFKKSMEQAELEDGIGASDYRYNAVHIMKTLWRLGDVAQAKKYQELYLQSLAEEYKECEELGKGPAELHLGERTCRRTSLYHMFEIHYFCGEYDQARKYMQQMEECEWCSRCACEECTEEWECKGFMALHDGQLEEAEKCFKHALECGRRGNDDAKWGLKILKMMQK